MKHAFLNGLAVAALALLSTASNAADTVYGSNFGSSNIYNTTLGVANAAFSSVPGSFELKSQDGITGVGVSGKTAGEIDIDESISGTFSQGIQIASIRLGLLFDGPEYNDVNEVAKITAYWVGGGSTSFTLTATGTHSALWTGTGSVASVGSGAVNGGTGAWDILNPFGSQLVSKITFAALTGVPGGNCSKCSNQSDYTLVSISAVPEPETYALMLAGLGLVGAIARRRKQRSAS